MQAAKMSQKEYLKRYLSKDDKKKKKNKRIKVGPKTVQIIDDDIDLKKMSSTIDDDEISIFNTTEDAPQIVGIVDDRGPIDFQNKQRWKLIADDGTGDIAITKVNQPKANIPNNNDSDIKNKKQTNSSTNKLNEKSLTKKNYEPKNYDKNSASSDLDLSPPRQREKRTRRRSRDLSPNRSSKYDKNSASSDLDLSPPRQRDKRRRRSRDLSPNKSSKYDKSSTSADLDLSPPRQRKKRTRSRSRDSSPNMTKYTKMKKTLDGTSAGLQNLKSLKEEEEAQKRKEAEMMKKMSKEISGHGQSVIIRDRKTGRKRDLHKEAAEKLEKQKVQDEIDAKYAKWGKGLKQMEDREEKMKRDLHEMNKPLARYADDKDLDRELRAREREDDPMLAYIKEKEIKEGKREPEKPKYQGSFMPNRFGIKPGHRWDGVDRSNGYEKKWFEAQNTKKAVEEEAFKWSTADM